MKFRNNLTVLLATVLALSACTTVVRERVVVREQVPVVIKHMPAPMQEVIITQPAANYNWVPGHWVWHGDGWDWQSGHWYQGAVRPMPRLIVEQITVAPSPSHYWVPGHWQWHGNDWIWVNGRWIH